jgi:hypothetical protein
MTITLQIISVSFSVSCPFSAVLKSAVTCCTKKRGVTRVRWACAQRLADWGAICFSFRTKFEACRQICIDVRSIKFAETHFRSSRVVAHGKGGHAVPFCKLFFFTDVPEDGWGAVLQVWRPGVWFLLKSLGFSIYLILSAALWPSCRLRLLTEMSTKNLPGV